MRLTIRQIIRRAGLAAIGAVFVALLLGGAAAPALFAQTPQGESVTLTFMPGRDATQPGTVTLTANGNQTTVTLDMTPGATGVEQPAHIHVGACPGVGAIKYPLTNVVDGKSTTTVDTPLMDLLNGQYAINVHKGPGADASIYTACVDLPARAGTSEGPSAGAGATTAAVRPVAAATSGAAASAGAPVSQAASKGPIAQQAPVKSAPVDVQAPSKAAPAVAQAPSKAAPAVVQASSKAAPAVAQAPSKVGAVTVQGPAAAPQAPAAVAQAPAKTAAAAPASVPAAPVAPAAVSAGRTTTQAPATAPRLPNTGNGGLLPQPGSSSTLTIDLLAGFAVFALLLGLLQMRREREG